MKKSLLSLLLLSAFPLLLLANTYTGNVTLNDQAAVDTFKLTTANADTLIGNIIISGADITNIDSLQNLQSISGDLFIFDNGTLANVDGLQNLQSIGGFLSIFNNAMLANVDGLQNLQSIGGSLNIQSNAMLANVDGLQNLQSIDGFLNIFNNDTLANVDGLQNLQSIDGSLFIQSNAMLANVDGLQNLQSIDGDLLIGLNAMLANVDGLQNLQNIDGVLSIRFNDRLDACCGVFPVLSNMNVGRSVTIRNNRPGCNSQMQIIDAGVCARILPPPVPTMSQWGLFLFGLITLTLGVVGIWNVKRRHKLS